MKANLYKKLKEKKGFTLIEMIIVIAIIAILIALIAPSLQKFLKTAKETKTDAAAKTLYTSASTYLVEQYTKDNAVADGTWTKGTMPEAFMTDYFNENEVGTKADYTVKIEGGKVALVTWTDDGYTGKYPKQKDAETPPKKD